MRIGSLFSGAGGLDVAVESVFGGEVIWQSEVDKAASTVLAHRFPGVPNLGDITTADFNNVEPVDVICGGFPCQDVSAAGKRAGIKHGTRSGLWSVFADVIDHLRPTWVVIENVRGLLSARAHRNLEPTDGVVGKESDGSVLRAAGAVLGDLADLGYDAQWATVAAADVGAPHRRERVFVLAANTEARQYADHQFTGRDGAELAVTRRDSDRSDAGAADSSGYGWYEGRPESARFEGRSDAAVSGDEPGIALLPTPIVADAVGARNTTAYRKVAPPSGQRNWDTLVDAVTKLNLRIAPHVVVPMESDKNGGVIAPGVALLPTPCAQQSGNSPEEHLRKKPGRKVLTDLAILVENGLMETGGALLPTPKAHDGEFGTPRTSGRPIEKSTHLGTIASLEQTSHWGKYEPAIRRWEALTRPAPAPTEPNKNGNPRLSAAFSEWLMGWPTGWVTAIGISRNDQLRIIGNGVCPQQAVAALRFLLTVSEVAA